MLGSWVVAGVLGARKNVWWSLKLLLAAFILVVAKISIGCICFGGRENVLVVARMLGGRRKPYWLHLSWWSPECLVVARTPIG
jgi:hypothetical protein